VNKRITQLSSVLSNQIAAGEVVERPASVVKELVENSLDAMSTQVEIDIEGGGIHLIRVRDNGHGILKEDLPLAFARHATSKISTIVDLGAIATLGFRGEALASVASVSRCRLMSKSLNQQDAWQIQLSQESSVIQPVAHSQGTTVEIADLFYNTPVRRKFIRSEKSEFQAIDDTVKRLALSYPLVSFRLTHQGRQIRHYPAVSARMNESSRVEKICGAAFIKQAVSLELAGFGLSLRGWLGSPSLLRRQADCQYFFVNQRMIKDRILNHVIKTAYQQQLENTEGTYPSYVLYLQIDPSEVDVNVHPTKQEVRFSQPRHIHDFISKGVGEALVQTLLPTTSSSAKMEYEGAKRKILVSPSLLPTPTSLPVMVKADRYALIEDERGVVICDLQKGKESLLQTYFMALWGRIPNKSLLFPQIINVPQNGLNDEIVTCLNEVGYWVKVKSHHLMVLAVPLITSPMSLCDFLLKLIEELVINKDKTAICEWLACHLSKPCLSVLDQDTFSWILRIWMENGNNTAWRHYSHCEFEQLIALPSGV
jgi:DNA mismatch repair protein MutL